MTTNFNLLITSPQKFKRAIGTETRHITTAVQHRAMTVFGSKGIGHKHLPRQLGVKTVTPGNAIAGRTQLTGHADRHGLKIRIQHIDLCIRYGVTNGHRALNTLGVFGRIIGRQRRVFAGAVEVHKSQMRIGFEQSFDPRCINNLTTGHDNFQGCQRFRMIVDHGMKQRRCQKECANTLLTDQFAQQFGVHMSTRCQHQFCTIEQCAPNFIGRRVKRNWRIVQQGFTAVQWGHIAVFHQTQDVALGQLDALGFTGRAGGINHQRQLVGFDRAHGRTGWQMLIRGTGVNQRLAQFLQTRLEFRLINHPLRPGVIEHVSNAFIRIVRINRQIGTTGFYNRQQTHQHTLRTLTAKSHHGFRPHALTYQVMCQLIGLSGQRLIRTQLALAPQRRMMRLGLHDRIKLLGNTAFGRIRRVVLIPLLQHALPFVGTHQTDLMHRLSGMSDKIRQNLRQLLHQSLHRRLTKQVTLIRHFQRNT